MTLIFLKDYQAKSYFFLYSTLIEPFKTYEYIFESDQLKMIEDYSNQMNANNVTNETYIHKDYEINRVYVDSTDGVKVPMTLVHRKGLMKSKENMVLMNIITSDLNSPHMGWAQENTPILQRGWMLAYVHARGSKDFGYQWEQEGILLKRPNMFHDLKFCTQWLIDQNYTKPQFLCGIGDGTGATAFSVLANQNPELFRAMVLKNGFYDILSILDMKELPFNNQEIQLWGDPENEENYHIIRSYDPYSNIKFYDYPAMLIVYSVDDSRAPFWNHLRYVSKLRNKKAGEKDLILKLNISDISGENNDLEQAIIIQTSEILSFLFINMRIIPEEI